MRVNNNSEPMSQRLVSNTYRAVVMPPATNFVTSGFTTAQLWTGILAGERTLRNRSHDIQVGPYPTAESVVTAQVWIVDKATNTQVPFNDPVTLSTTVAKRMKVSMPAEFSRWETSGDTGFVFYLRFDAIVTGSGVHAIPVLITTRADVADDIPERV